MPRPLIAIPGRFAASTSALRYEAEVTARALAEAVFAAGGEPLTMHPSEPGDVAQRLAWAQGVLLPGGGDLAAHWTGQDPHPSLYDVDEVQDAFDLAVARHCLETGLPLLAICRGLQVVNALRGGRVVQDMPSNHRHRRHLVSIAPGSRLSTLAGPTAHVSCYHHQCVDRLGSGLRAVATAEDGTVEAVEIDDVPGWFLGLQWHPEDTWNTDASIFDEFVDAVRRRPDSAVPLVPAGGRPGPAADRAS